MKWAPAGTFRCVPERPMVNAWQGPPDRAVPFPTRYPMETSMKSRDLDPTLVRRSPWRTAPVSLALVAGASLALSACSMSGHGGAAHDAHGEESAGHEGGDDHHGGMSGRPGDAAEVDRTITVVMSDAMDYSPAVISVAKGETIRFEIGNEGRLVHEFVLGSDEAIGEHHEMMKRMPGMEHDEPNSLSLESGARGDLLWHFTEAGNVSFACLQPGHYEAGMRGAVIVGGDAS